MSSLQVPPVRVRSIEHVHMPGWIRLHRASRVHTAWSGL